MKEYDTGSIRNVALVAHGGTGKTSLVEAMLFEAGAISRLGRVEDGTTTSDFDPDELKRKMSVNLSVLPLEWKDVKINIVDTPGYADFVGEQRCGTRAADALLILVDASAGVQVGTESAWSCADEGNTPRAFFVNRIDRENADFDRTVSQIQEMFGKKCVPIQLPIGAQGAFTGIIDLIALKALVGEKGTDTAIPADLMTQALAYREQLIEAVAEADDDIITKYLEGETLSEEEICRAVRKAIVQGVAAPIMVGSAARNVGVTCLLDEIVTNFPSPSETLMPTATTADGATVTLKPDAKGPLAALVFKTTADPFVGRLTYFRVFSGAIHSNTEIWNATHGKAERIGQLFQVRGKGQEPVTQVAAGDIGAVAKLVETGTNDTLSTKDHPIVISPIALPAPVYRAAVSPKTRGDADKVGHALQRLAEEDPTLHIERDPETHEMILSGLGESHIEVAAEKMHRKFNVAVDVKLPRVPYRETVTQKTHAHYRHKKQTGGAGQFGEIDIEIEPLPRGSGFEFTERIVGGTVPREYWPAVEKGVREQMLQGVIAGYPVVDVRVTLVDGKTHPVDSKAVAFEIAGSQAIKEGVPLAKPILIEPIMELDITVPDTYTGDVIGDLNTKRAHIHGMSPAGKGATTIEAEAPLSELQRYATDVRSITQGRGTFKMRFGHYQEVPQHVTQKVIEEHKKEQSAHLAHAGH
jgi:elongation factor G